MGVRTVWIIDPKTKSGRQRVDDIWAAAETLQVSGTEIHVDLVSLFAQLDQFRI